MSGMSYRCCFSVVEFGVSFESASVMGVPRYSVMGLQRDQMATGRMELQIRALASHRFLAWIGRAALHSSIPRVSMFGSDVRIGIPSTRGMPGHLGSICRPRATGKAAIVARVLKLHTFLPVHRYWCLQTANTSIPKASPITVCATLSELLSEPLRYYAMLKQVVIDTAKLMAHWQAVGFMHGVT